MDNSAVFHKKDGFTVRTMGDETLFLDPDGSFIHIADEVGGFIYQQIDGTRNLKAVLDAILEAYDVDEKTAEKDLHRFIKEMVTQEILEAQ